MGKVNGVRALDLIDRVVGGEGAEVVVEDVSTSKKDGGKEDLKERAEQFLRENTRKK